ncbi:hypothetical protein [Caballeronia sp. GaOx3]|uniref:hypothetical protein n=1 Tax=Caballeronia sp. GaOx3 TaxID=2921740 RepID=UPI0020290BA0|nr:hypothetical protein [Caballeronia sp. GaOx3]
MPPDDPDTIAFDIGWDFARFGRRMDAAVCSASLLTGYAAGREHFRVAQHRPDRFVSKWLQLRLNAFKRRRILCPDVDPLYLRRIDCDTCPITLVTLTRGALRDSDWSVDRINNDGAYAPGNLMVMSVRANRAKGTKDYRDVVLLASQPADVPIVDPERKHLSKREWERVACVMVGAADVAEAAPTLKPLLTRIPEDSRAPLYYVLQQMLLHAVARASSRNQLVKALNRFQPSRERCLGLRFAAERLSVLLKTVNYAYDALDDELFQRQLRCWFLNIPRAHVPELLSLCACYGAQRCEPTLPTAWSVETHGRFSEPT